VLGALEVVRTLNDRGIETERPFEVAIWTNEEGTRFTPVMMGSGVFAGVFGLDQVLARTDLEGRSVGEELRRIGYAGEAAPGKPIAAYLEAHTEQGPVLEAQACTDRCGDRAAGTALVRCRDHRSGRSCRTDADAPAQGCAVRLGSAGGGGPPHRARTPARRHGRLPAIHAVLARTTIA
jgi:hypothetical protein